MVEFRSAILLLAVYLSHLFHSFWPSFPTFFSVNQILSSLGDGRENTPFRSLGAESSAAMPVWQCVCETATLPRPGPSRECAALPCEAWGRPGGSLFLEDPIGRITLCQPISQSQPPTLPFSLPPPVGGSLWRDLTRIPVGIFSWKALHALNSLWVSSPGRLSDI